MMKQSNMIIRNPMPQDILPLIELLDVRVYPDLPETSRQDLQDRIQCFPEGHFIAVIDEQIVGYTAVIRVPGKIALKSHTLENILKHDPLGDYLYIIETCVDSKYRKMHIGQQLYDECKRLCKRLGLKGIVAGGRMPGLIKEIEHVKTPERYVELVKSKILHDNVILFMLKNEFDYIGILENYLPEDKSSLGHATHFVWKNPAVN